MHEIICSNCSKAFKIDEAGYANILKQVRDGNFDKQLHERLELAEREKHYAIALAEAKIANELQKAAAVKDMEIQALKTQLDAGEMARKQAVAEALGLVSKERDGLADELEQARTAQQAAAQLAEAKLAHAPQGADAKKDAEIQTLQAKLEAGDVARQLAVNEAVGVVARERDGLKNDLTLITVKNQLEEKAIGWDRAGDAGPARKMMMEPPAFRCGALRRAQARLPRNLPSTYGFAPPGMSASMKAPQVPGREPR